MTLKTKECPSCAMEVDVGSKVCPICGYEFAEFTPIIKWVALLLILTFLLMLIF
jgi:RNA polymerase subunit RPABC4/transcription elongation factor Spt4